MADQDNAAYPLIMLRHLAVPSIAGVGALAQSLLGVMLPKDKQVRLVLWVVWCRG